MSPPLNRHSHSLKNRKKLPPQDAKPSSVALGLVPKVFNPIDVVQSAHEPRGMIDPHMVEVRGIQRIVAPESVGAHDAVRQDHVPYDG